MLKLFLLLLLLLFSCVSKKEISISFDDAPQPDSQHYTGQKRATELLAQLKEAKVSKVIFYAIPGKVDSLEELERLKRYHSAGHLIGNHTWNHLSADKNDSDIFFKNVMKADQFLKNHNLFTPIFRYPYLKRGEDLLKVRSLRNSLQDAGYKDGYVTIETYDWYIDTLFQESLKQKHKVNFENLKKLYIDTIIKSINFYDSVATNFLKYSPKHVLHLHENDLAALFIADLVRELRKQGWDIIDPEKSYQDEKLTEYPDVQNHTQGRIIAKALENGYTGKTSSDFENKGNLYKLFREYKVTEF